MLLDSTILIDFLRREERALNFIAKCSESLFTTELNIFELITGIYFDGVDVKKRMDSVSSLGDRLIVLPLDRKATLKAAEISGKLLSIGKKIESVDCLIAGIALTNNINRIVTANISHFERIKEIKIVTY